MPELTKDQIAADRAVIAAATPGPWKADEQNEFNDYCVWGPKHDGFCGEDGFIANVDNGQNLAAAFDLSCENAAFIAAARTGWPSALDEVERLTAELERRYTPVNVSLKELRESTSMIPPPTCDCDQYLGNGLWKYCPNCGRKLEWV